MAKIERTKNAVRNIFFGVLLKMYNIICPFIMRTAMIYFLGVEYLGLNSLFASILSVLNLAELGVGSAMVFSMYKPIAQDDESTICALMKLYRTYYRVIGLVIAALGCVLIPFLPKLIKSDVPAGMNIYLLYMLNLGATVLSYWMFAYKNSLLGAHQRNDIGSKVTMVTNTIQYGAQFLVLWLVRDYYLYVIVALMTQVITNVVTAIIANHLYPNYKPKGSLGKAQVRVINRKIIDLFTAKLGAIVVNSVDTIVISAFLGLTVLAVYQNYYFILSSIMGFVTILFTSITAGIGNSLIVETKEKNFKDLSLFTFIICWIAGVCACCFLNLFQPFIEVWVGKDLLLPYSAVVCLVIYYFVFEVNQLLCVYKDAAGIWHEDRFRPLITAFVNLGLNLALVQFWGIYGIILSTVLSILFVGMPWLFHNLFATVFEKKYLIPYLKKLAVYVCVCIISCVTTTLLCGTIHADPWVTLAVSLGICCVLPNVMFFAVYHRTPEFRSMLNLLNNMLHGRLDRMIKKVVN